MSVPIGDHVLFALVAEIQRLPLSSSLLVPRSFIPFSLSRSRSLLTRYLKMNYIRRTSVKVQLCYRRTTESLLSRCSLDRRFCSLSFILHRVLLRFLAGAKLIDPESAVGEYRINQTQTIARGKEVPRYGARKSVQIE